MNDEIGVKLTRIDDKVNALLVSLYGRNPSDLGDIGEIKASLRSINGFKTRLIRLEVVVFVLASGGLTGITKGIGWW